MAITNPYPYALGPEMMAPPVDAPGIPTNEAGVPITSLQPEFLLPPQPASAPALAGAPAAAPAAGMAPSGAAAGSAPFFDMNKVLNNPLFWGSMGLLMQGESFAPVSPLAGFSQGVALGNAYMANQTRQQALQTRQLLAQQKATRDRAAEERAAAKAEREARKAGREVQTAESREAYAQLLDRQGKPAEAARVRAGGTISAPSQKNPMVMVDPQGQQRLVDPAEALTLQQQGWRPYSKPLYPDPRDAPIPAKDLPNWTTAEGADIPFGTTYRQAEALGARPRAPTTEGQGRAQFFHTMMGSALEQWDEALGMVEGDAASLAAGPGELVVQRLAGERVANVFRSPARQKAETVKRTFTEAMLRKVSGAAVPPQERYEMDLTYWPQYGDKAPVIEAKRRLRAEAYAAAQQGASAEYLRSLRRQHAQRLGVSVSEIPDNYRAYYRNVDKAIVPAMPEEVPTRSGPVNLRGR